MLREDAKLDRQNYINQFKRQKTTAKRETLTCEACKKAFANLKQHLNKTPDCQNKSNGE